MKEELKTLKDIEGIKNKLVLKNEAVKWVKYYDRKEEDDCLNAICNWIEDFFNLTEENLRRIIYNRLNNPRLTS